MKYFDEIKKQLELKAKGSNITKNTVLKNLGLDSLDLMDMIVTLEEKIGVQIQDDKLDQIETISDLMKVIDEALEDNGK